MNDDLHVATYQNCSSVEADSVPSQGLVGAALLEALVGGPQLLQSRSGHADRPLIRPPVHTKLKGLTTTLAGE